MDPANFDQSLLQNSFSNGSSRDQLFGVSSSRPSAAPIQSARASPAPMLSPQPPQTLTAEACIEFQEPDDDVIAAIMKGTLQLGSVLYTLVLPDEHGVLHVHTPPLHMIESLREAALCKRMDEANVLHFENDWKKYAHESTDPIIKLYEDKSDYILNQTFTSGFRDVAWAIAGLSTQDIALFIVQLVSAEDCLLTKYYPEQCSILKNFAALLRSLAEIHEDDSVLREKCFLDHFDSNLSKVAIYPVLGKDHAVYMTILPPAENALFTVIFCDGSGGDKYHFTELVDGGSGIRGHCIVQCDYDAVRHIFNLLAICWRRLLIHNAISNELKLLGPRDAEKLFNGFDELFPGEKVYVELQATGNCGLHNLQEALWFSCAPGFRKVDSLQLRYCMGEAALQLMRKNRSFIDAFCDTKGHVDGFVLAEMCAWKSLELEFECIDPNLNNECVREIRATHSGKAVCDDALKKDIEEREEFFCRMMELISSDVNEESLQECFRARLSQEQVADIISEMDVVKTLYEHGGPSPPPPRQGALDIL